MWHNHNNKIQKARLARAFLCLILISLTSCTSLQSRIETVTKITKNNNLHTEIIKTNTFNLFSASNNSTFTSDVTIIIEGDGFAWENRYTASNNPTPISPIGLKILSKIKKPAIYVARPCQYEFDQRCKTKFWTSDRFHPDVIKSYEEAIEIIKTKHKAQNINIIGFSGGAYIALKLASNRQDINKVTTIAGVLNPKSWTEYHNISPLNLNQSIEELLTTSAHTTFEHICSEDDEIMPCSLTKQFMTDAQTLGLKNHHLTTFRGYDHSRLWEEKF